MLCCTLLNEWVFAWMGWGVVHVDDMSLKTHKHYKNLQENQMQMEI